MENYPIPPSDEVQHEQDTRGEEDTMLTEMLEAERMQIVWDMPQTD